MLASARFLSGHGLCQFLHDSCGVCRATLSGLCGHLFFSLFLVVIEH